MIIAQIIGQSVVQNVKIYIHSVCFALNIYVQLRQTFEYQQFQFSMLDQTFSSEFEVEEIVDQKQIDGQIHYLVKWVGYGHEQNTWEPLRHMTNSKEKIRRWEKFKEKHLSLLQNDQIMDKLNIGSSRNHNPAGTDSPYIEGISKSSTPYRNFKPIVLLDRKEKSPGIENEQKAKTMSLFDRPEVKKITKRRKIQRKQKELQMFEQRIKSRPKIWEKYLHNEQQAIKLANKKIKQVVDQVFGPERGQTRRQLKQVVPTEEKQKKIETSQTKASFEPITKTRIIEETEKNGLEKSLKKKKTKPLDIFSDSDEETSHLQKPLKKLNQLKKATLIQDKKDCSSESINESTNFISNIKFAEHKLKKYKEQKVCQKLDESQKSATQKDIEQIDKKLNLLNSANQQKVENFTFKQEKSKANDLRSLKAFKSNDSKIPRFIQLDTVKLTDDMLKMLEEQSEQKTQTQESSSSNKTQRGCDQQKLSQNLSSSSSSSQFDDKGSNIHRISVTPKSTSCTEKPECKKNTQNHRSNHNDLLSCQLMTGNIQAKINQNFGIKIIQEVSTQKKELKELPINFDEIINISDQIQLSKIKVQESRKSQNAQSENNHIKQQQNSLSSSNKSSTKNFAQNVKLEWFSQVKLSQDNISGLKIESEKKAAANEKIEDNNFQTKLNEFIPFECSVSTIEDVKTNDQRFVVSQHYYIEKVLPKFSTTANIMGQQSLEKEQKNIESDSIQNQGQRIINYSSMTNHQSTAIPSQVSGQDFHVFTDQNGFNLNLLRNNSLSTRASLNSHKTQIDREIRNQRNGRKNDERTGENDVMNQGIYQSTPEHIFSSSSESLDRVNSSDFQKRLKNDHFSKSLSLEHVLELLCDKSMKFSNNIQSKEESRRQINQLFAPKRKIINIIELDNDEPQIEISSSTAGTQNAYGSQKCSKIVLNFLDIGLSNKAKSLNQLPKGNDNMITDLTKSKASIQQGLKKINQDHDISDFHRMFILENTVTEQLK